MDEEVRQRLKNENMNEGLDGIYKVYMFLHRADLNVSAKLRLQFFSSDFDTKTNSTGKIRQMFC